MKHIVGDKVTVRNDLVDRQVYGKDSFEDWGMGVFKGKEVTISEVHKDYYKIKEDEEDYNFTDEMFED